MSGAIAAKRPRMDTRSRRKSRSTTAISFSTCSTPGSSIGRKATPRADISILAISALGVAFRPILEPGVLQVLNDMAVVERDFRRDRVSIRGLFAAIAPDIEENLIERVTGLLDVDPARRRPLGPRRRGQGREQRQQQRHSREGESNYPSPPGSIRSSSYVVVRARRYAGDHCCHSPTATQPRPCRNAVDSGG